MQAPGTADCGPLLSAGENWLGHQLPAGRAREAAGAVGRRTKRSTLPPLEMETHGQARPAQAGSRTQRRPRPLPQRGRK